MTLPTEDQIEAARTKVRNMLHAADHGNHLGEMAVLRMAASGELFEALKAARSILNPTISPNACALADAAIAGAHGWSWSRRCENCAAPELLEALKAADEILATWTGPWGERQKRADRLIRTALSLAQPYEAEVEKDGLQTNVAPPCGVGPSDLTGRERKPSSERDRFIGLTVEEVAERTRQGGF